MIHARILASCAIFYLATSACVSEVAGGARDRSAESEEVCAGELTACHASDECRSFVNCIGANTAECAGATVPRAGMPIDSLCMAYLAARDEACEATAPAGRDLYLSALLCADSYR